MVEDHFFGFRTFNGAGVAMRVSVFMPAGIFIGLGGFIIGAVKLGRRGFLGVLGAFALDPERALWVPGAKKISVPAARDFEELFRERYFRPAAMAIHQKMLAEYNARITLVMERVAKYPVPSFGGAGCRPVGSEPPVGQT